MRIIARLLAFALPMALGSVATLVMIAGVEGQSLPLVPNSSSGLYYGYPASAANWNAWFAAKQDCPMPTYTVATLPACNSALYGYWYLISDATTPTYNGTPAGSGAVIVPVVCNGTAWTTH